MDKITLEEYRSAVEKLIPLAQGDTSGSRVAAQVLLSAYDGASFQLNIVDLGYLDEKHYCAALDVIRGRTEHRVEPHTLIPNGGKIFPSIWKQWEGLHVKYRAELV
jgi:hypothetical protein